MKAKLAALAALGLVLAAAAPAWPDDWDGLGFVAAATRFDMARFAPHPPGYPVYVAAMKVLRALGASPLAAAWGVSVLAGVGAALLAQDAGARAFGPARGWALALALVLAPLPFRAVSGVGSEALALFFFAAAVHALVRRDGVALGLAVGLGLGVRLSWAPLFVALLFLAPRGGRARAGAGAAVGVLAWLAPLVALVGASDLRALFTTHLAGHATRWGGTALTDPGAARLGYLARDLAVDGLGAGSDPLGLAVAGVLVAVALVGLGEWRARGMPGGGAVAFALGPYLVWIAVGQNLREQPRHALPIVAALAALLALAAMSCDRGRRLGVVLVIVVGLRTLGDAHARATVPPPGAQLALAVRELPAPSAVAVFGGPSVRFFEGTDVASSGHPAAELADVRLALGRLPTLPARVLVTRELAGFGAPPYPVKPWRRFCRPERVDRRAPCLDVLDLEVPFLPPL